MEFLKQYEILFKKARTDLKAGKNLLEDFENGDDELDLETIMFHFQQCAEKLLKSLLAYNELHYTKTHNIKELVKGIRNNNIVVDIDIEILMPLTYYAVEGRYAIIHDDLEDGDIYITLLDELLKFVKDTINKEKQDEK